MASEPQTKVSPMTDPKAAKAEKKVETPEVSGKSDGASAAVHREQLSASSERYVALGRLRRDTMILGASEDVDFINDLAATAVRENRASEVYVIEAIGYFSESEIDFAPAQAAAVLVRADQNAERVPLLNPSTGQDALDNAAGTSKATTVEPAGNASGSGDDNKGAGTGTGNEAQVKT